MNYIGGYSASECYCCGNKKFSTLGKRTEILSNEKALYSFTFEDVVCEECAFIFSKQRQRQDAINQYYESYHSNASSTTGEEHRARYAYLENYIKNESVVYEIGGGINSSFTKFLKSKNVNVANIEVADKWPQGETVDLIVSYYLLEHINDLGSFLIKISDLLKVEGFFVFEIPDFFKNPGASLNEEHVNHFNYSSITAMAVRYGFELVSNGFENGSRSFGSVATLKKKYSLKDISSAQLPQVFKQQNRDFFDQSRLKAVTYYKQCDEYRKCLISEIENICRKVESSGQTILIWGCNQNFIRLFNIIGALNIYYDVVDSSKKKQSLAHFKIKIRDPEEIILDGYAKVFICATNAYDDIINTILNNSTLSKDCLHRVDFASV